MVVADEEEGCEAGQFPENKERDHIIGRDRAEHRRHEEQQQDHEPGEPWIPLKVPAGVEKNERTDAGDQQNEDERQPVKPEPAGDAKRRYRPEGHGKRLSRGDMPCHARIGHEADHSAHRTEASCHGRPPAQRDARRDHEADDERKRQGLEGERIHGRRRGKADAK